MDWACAIEQLRSEGYFGDVEIWHNGSSMSRDGIPIAYDELEILEDSTLTNVKPSEQELIDAYVRWSDADTLTKVTARRGIADLRADELDAHIDSLITDFASAKALIKEMAHMILDIRAQLAK